MTAAGAGATQPQPPVERTASEWTASDGATGDQHRSGGPDPAAAARGRASRLRSRALLPGLLGAVLALVSGAQAWWRATGEGVAVAFTGTESTAGLSQALGVVALAGLLLVLVLRTRGRRVVGVLLTLAGLGIVGVGALRQRPSATTVRNQVREVSLADSFELAASVWPYAYAGTGLLVLVCGLTTLLTAARWPARVDRFSRSAERAVGTTADDDPAEVWRAQDAGLDPTTGPDVRIPGPQDTMGAAEDRRTSPPE